MRIPDRIVLSGPTAAITAGTSVQVTAVVFDTKDRPITDAVITWASSNAAIAPVDGAGVVATQRPGAATITASSAGESATLDLTVVGIPCVQTPTLGTSTTVSDTVSGSVSGTDCVFASGLPSKGHAITIASPVTLNIDVQGAGLIPVIAVASSSWDLSYNADAGTVPGVALRSVRTLPAGDFVIWVASGGHVNADYTLSTSVMSSCTMDALARTLAPGDSVSDAIGPTSCWRNGLVRMQGWRIIAAADEEIVIDAYGVGGSPVMDLAPTDAQSVTSANGGGAPTATLGYVPAIADTFALWVSMQDNVQAAFSVRRRIPQPPTCLTPLDTLAVGDTIGRLMYYGDCERGSTGVRMHSYLLAIDSTSRLDIRMSAQMFTPGFALRTLTGEALHIAQFDDTLHLARLRATLVAGEYLVTVATSGPGALGLYSLWALADPSP